MSERGKKIAKWLVITLWVILLLGFFASVINESILWYFLGHTKAIILILIVISMFLLYFKKYKNFFGLLVFIGIIYFADVVVHYSCCTVAAAFGWAGVNDTATTAEMQSQVQHDEGVEEGKPEPSVP